MLSSTGLELRIVIFVQPWAGSSVAPCLRMTGAWLLWDLLPAGSGPGVLRNMLQPLTSLVFPACRELCGQLWPAFDPFDLDEGCRLAVAEEALRGAIPSGASIYAVSDSPSHKSLSGMIEARSVSGIFENPTLPRHRRLHLEACRVSGCWAWLTANPSCVDSHVPSTLFRVVSSVVFVCHYGITTRLVVCVGRYSTVGVITPLPVAAVEIGFYVDPSSTSSPPPAACRHPADVWVPRGVSGFAEAWDFSVSSLLRSSHLSSASPSVADVFHEVETRKRAFQDTALSAGPPSPACLGGLRVRVVQSLPERCGLDCLRVDCTAHQLHPSQGKRACNPETFPGVH